MTVDDVTVIALYPKLIEYVVAHLGIVAQDVVPALRLFLYLLIIEQIAFESRHLRLTKEW